MYRRTCVLTCGHQRAATGAAGPRTPAIVPGLQRHWRADAEPDRVTRFINWWIIVECLEIETSNITPARQRLALLFNTDEGRWGVVGRLWQRRNDLVHGNDWEVPGQQLQQIELLARVLLTARLLGAVPDVVRQEFLSAAGIVLTAIL
jgi:hypothetical protein